jgi:hypothetical protein
MFLMTHGGLHKYFDFHHKIVSIYFRLAVFYC